MKKKERFKYYKYKAEEYLLRYFSAIANEGYKKFYTTLEDIRKQIDSDEDPDYKLVEAYLSGLKVISRKYPYLYSINPLIPLNLNNVLNGFDFISYILQLDTFKKTGCYDYQIDINKPKKVLLAEFENTIDMLKVSRKENRKRIRFKEGLTALRIYGYRNRTKYKSLHRRWTYRMIAQEIYPKLFKNNPNRVINRVIKSFGLGFKLVNGKPFVRIKARDIKPTDWEKNCNNCRKEEREKCEKDKRMCAAMEDNLNRMNYGQREYQISILPGQSQDEALTDAVLYSSGRKPKRKVVQKSHYV